MSPLSLRPSAGPCRAAPTSPALAGFRPAAAALAVAAAFTLQAPPLHAQPVGPQVIAGQASFARNGNNLVVTTQNAAGASHSAINWQSFSVPAGSLTRFNQPSAASTSINRVVGPDPSAIFGTLSSNGRLVLVNPAGIAVGKGAVVDTAGFTASTLPMSDADAIAGRLLFSGNGGPLQVDGNVVARGGDIVLIAPQVHAGADAVVQGDGSVVLAAGHKVEITGRGLEGIRLEVQAGGEAVNLGQLKGDAVGMFAGTLRHSGLISAQAVSTVGGKVVLRAAGDALVSGAVNAAGANGKGGSVDVLGQRVGLLAGAAIDASGAQGGGQVRIGGDYQGSNSEVPNAARTYVDANATIHADATQQGDGGRVIVWSDEATRMDGEISARGGAQGGNGGFAEVSGKKYLAFTGRADLRAPRGAAGTLLLDPEDVEIVSGGAGGSPSPSPTGPGYEFNTDGGPTTITDADLSAQLGMSNVQVTTGNSFGTGTGGLIHLHGGANVNWDSGSTLSLLADKGIQLDGTINATSLGAANGMLHLQSWGGDITQGANNVLKVAGLYAQADGGSVLLDGSANNSVGRVAGSSSGAFHLTNAETLTVGAVETAYGGGSGVSSGSDIKLVATTGDLNLDDTYVEGHGIVLQSVGGHVNANGTNVNAYTDGVDITAGGNITGAAQISARGGINGWVHLTAANGSVSFGQIDSRGSYSGIAGGEVRLVARNNIAGGSIYVNGTTDYGGSGGAGGNVSATSSDGSIAVGAVDSYGGMGSMGAGGAGGAITLSAVSGSISTGDIHAGGGYGTTGGGRGADVKLNAGTGVTVASVSAAGGNAGSSAGGNAGDGGSITLAATAGDIAVGSNLNADGGYADNGSGGAGGHVGIDAGGSVLLHQVSASGGGGGPAAAAHAGDGGTVQVTARNGNIDFANTLSGSSVTSYGGAMVYGRDGDSLAAGGRGGSITLSASSTDSEMGTITVGGLLAADGGYSYGDDSGVVGTGGAGGAIRVDASGDIQLGDVAASAGGGVANGSTGGLIHIASSNGGVNVSGGLQANGGIALGDGIGGTGGTIDVQASQSIQIGYVSAGGGPLFASLGSGPGSVGSGSGGAGGSVSLSSLAGDIGVTQNIDVSGGPAMAVGNGSAGGEGGSVMLRALAGSIHVGASQGGGIRAGGGEGAEGANGGVGGTIELNAFDINIASVNADGGSTSVGSAGGGTGGAGGSIKAIVGGTLFSTNMSAAGGAGAQGNGSISAGGSGGGAGGTIELDMAGGDVAFDSFVRLNASGGDGGSANVDETNANGGLGGAGGSVTLTSSGGSLSLQNTELVAGGGWGGGNGDDETQAANGSGGGVTVRAATDLFIDSSYSLGSASFTGQAGGNIDVRAPITTRGAAITLSAGDPAAPAPQPGAWLHVNAPIDSTDNGAVAGGAIKLSATGDVELNPWQPPAFIPMPSAPVVTGGPVSVTSGGTLHLLQGITSDASGDAVVLATNSIDVGPDGTISTPNGRWLAYIGSDLSANNFGALTSGNFALWNRTFSGSPPGTVSENGNRYLFAYQPTVDIVASAGSKVYDGTALDLSGDYSSSALVDASAYGDVFLQDVLSGSLALPAASKNVGTYTIGLGTLGVPGYAMNLSGNVGSITPRTLNLSATAADKEYDGTTAAVASFTDNRVAGDVLTVGSDANFTDKNVGSGKAVNMTSLDVTGTDAGNYVLADSSLSTTASITPRVLHVSANNLVKEQGLEYVFQGTEFSADRLVAGESIASVSLASAGTPADAVPGAYAITPSNLVAGANFLASNYSVSYLNGVLAVGSPAAQQQVLNQVVTFATLFIQEAQAQAEQDKKKSSFGKDDIVLTDTQCKP